MRKKKSIEMPSDEDVAELTIAKTKQLHLEFLTEAQRDAWTVFEKSDILFLIGPAGVGKALTLDSKVYTPNGYKLMRDIVVGDQVCSSDGTSSKVIGVYPQGKKAIYRITFKDGDFVDCCEEHLWLVDDNQGYDWENRVVNTKYIIGHLRSPNGRRKLSIKVPKPVQFNEIETIIDPYMMGVLLGDGCFKGSNVDFTTIDDEIVKEINECILSSYVIKENKTTYRIVKKNRSGKPNIYKEELKRYKLWQLNSSYKFIPDDYLYNSIKNRIALLQGLLDTDGYAGKKNVYFYTTSQQLSEQVKELVCSLGGLVSVITKEPFYTYKGIKKQGKTIYMCRIYFNDARTMFRLKRKADRVKVRQKYLVKRIIDNVEYIGEKEAQCIYVDSSSHLYLTNNFIVTHNTHLAVAFALKELLDKTKVKIILTRPVVEAGEHLGWLPGSLESKLLYYTLPIYDCLDQMCGRNGNGHREFINKKIELAPLAFMRGRAGSLDSLLITPDGTKRMGDIKVGDFVIGSNGTSTKVTGVYPQGEKKVYKVYFTDGSSTECCGEHLWLTQSLSEKRHNKDYSVKTTEEIKNTLRKHNQSNHKIPLISSPVEFETKDVPIDPYLLGLLLGDGHLGKHTIRFCTTDIELIDSIKSRLPSEMTIEFIKNCDFVIKNKKRNRRNTILEKIEKLELNGSKSDTKFVPEIYKINSVNVRLDILRGLLDTDGWIWKTRTGKHSIQYYSTSEQLANDVVFIVQSLGGIAYKRKREFAEKDNHFYKDRLIRHTRPCYVVDIVLDKINPFYLKRKAQRYCTSTPPIRLISKIEEIGQKECQCIRVEASDHLYLTDNFLVTHNSFKNATCLLDEAQNCSYNQLKLFLTRLGHNSKLIVTADPSQSDLGNSRAVMEIINKIRHLDRIGVVEFSEECVVRHPLVAQITKLI